MSTLKSLQNAFGRHPVGSSPAMVAFSNEARVKRNYKLVFFGGVFVGGIAVWWLMKKYNESSPPETGQSNFKMKMPSEKPKAENETYSSFSGQQDPHLAERKRKREKLKEKYFSNFDNG